MIRSTYKNSNGVPLLWFGYDSSGQLLRDNRVLTVSLTIKCQPRPQRGGISRDAVSRLNALTGSYDRTRGDEQGTGVSSLRNPETVMRHCNHCHGQLGLIVHRKWMLRFCSKSCKKAYEHKLQEERRAKLRHLAFLAPGAQTNYRAGPSK
jgi:hypothetical protein